MKIADLLIFSVDTDRWARSVLERDLSGICWTIISYLTWSAVMWHRLDPRLETGSRFTSTSYIHHGWRWAFDTFRSFQTIQSYELSNRLKYHLKILESSEKPWRSYVLKLSKKSWISKKIFLWNNFSKIFVVNIKLVFITSMY